jgi:DNA-3-methyladenine glycosylase I
MQITTTLAVKDRDGWRDWLSKNHDKETEIWLVFSRKGTGKQTVAYQDALDEALSFGWIDSSEKKLDDERYALRFTPRRPGSGWSERNLGRAERLIAEGKMTASGFEKLPEENRKKWRRSEGLPIPDGGDSMTNKKRCAWTGDNPLMIRYHDEEWGVPVHDDTVLFEFLVLEGAQAGLTWQTVLNKRDNYRRAFSGFNPSKVARYSEEDIARLLSDPGIIRNRLKVRSAVRNAEGVLALQEEFGSFDAYIWQFVGGKPIDHKVRSMDDIPATTIESGAMSKDLKKRGFTFVGPTICYAFMQAVGMVNDHQVDCFRYPEIQSKKG